MWKRGTTIRPTMARRSQRTGLLRGHCAGRRPLRLLLASIVRERSQGDVAVLLRRVAVGLVLEHLQGADDLAAGLARVDHVVEEAARGGDVGVGELRAVLLDELGAPCV